MPSLANSSRIMRKVARRASSLERDYLLTRYVAIGKARFGEEFRYELEDISRKEAQAREDRRRKNLPDPSASLPQIMAKLTEDDQQNLLNLLKEADSVDQVIAALKGAGKLAREMEKLNA